MRESREYKKVSAIIAAFLSCVFVMMTCVFSLIDYLDLSGKATFINVFLVSAFGTAIVACFVVALKKRLQDLDAGEEDDLDQY